MASKKPVIHARDHKKGGADPLDIVFPTSNYSNAIINEPVGGLVLYWKLDELGNTTTDAVDSSGNGHTGTYAIGGGFSTTATHPTLGVAALADGTAASFDGVLNNVGIGSTIPGIQAFGEMSVEGWIDTSQTTHLDDAIHCLDTSVGSIVDCDNVSTTQRYFRLELVFSTGKLKFTIFDSGMTGASLTTATVINDGARHHIVATYDGTTIVIYVDGAVDATSTPGLSGISTVNGGLWVGSSHWQTSNFYTHSHFAGVVDELALYTVALPLTSVQTHFLIGSTASNPPSGTAGGVLGGNYPDPVFNPSVAGAGLAIDGADEVLSVNVDGSTIEINSDTLRVKDSGITLAKLSSTGAADGKWLRDSSGAMVWDSIDAVDVAVADAGGYFTSTDVEGALQELGSAGGGGGGGGSVVGFGTVAGEISTTGTTFAAGVDVLASAISFTADGVSSYLVQLVGPGQANTTASKTNKAQLNLDGSASQWMVFAGAVFANTGIPLIGACVITPAGGTHTVNVRAYCDGGTLRFFGNSSLNPSSILVYIMQL